MASSRGLEARQPKLFSTRRLGTAAVSAVGAASILAGTAATAQAHEPWHQYMHGCVFPKVNYWGTIGADDGSYYIQSGHAGVGCTTGGQTGTGYGTPCVTSRSSGGNFGGLACSNGKDGYIRSVESIIAQLNPFSTFYPTVRLCGVCTAGTTTKPHILSGKSSQTGL